MKAENSVVWLACLIFLTGCHNVKSEKTFIFGLSNSHNIKDVNWPSNWDSDWSGYDGDCALTLKLPGQRTFNEKLKQIAIQRRGDSIYFIGAHMHNMDLNEVYVNAQRLIKAWHFDDREFANWYQKAKGKNSERFETNRNDLRPALTLKILHSFNDTQPWFISFEVTW